MPFSPRSAPLLAIPPPPDASGITLALASGEHVSLGSYVVKVVAWARGASDQDIAAGLPAELQVVGSTLDAGEY